MSVSTSPATCNTTTGRLFDPVVWLTPLVLVTKIILQDSWHAKLDWDERLSTSLSYRWKSFASDLNGIHVRILPWWLQCTKSNDLPLHIFSNASECAFAAGLYSKVPDEDGQYQTHLISAKTKSATLRSLKSSGQLIPWMITPSLELRGTLLAAWLLISIVQEFGFPLVNCRALTDSEMVLCRLNSNLAVVNYISHV